MASSLFGQQNSPTNQPSNNLMGILQQFNQFKQTMAGKDPQAIVQGLIQSGQMSKQQFEQLSAMANQFQSLFGQK